MGALDKLWEGFKNVGKAADKKKKDKLGLGKTRGGQTKDADETMKDLEREEKQYAIEPTE